MVVLRVLDVDATWTAVRLVTDLWKREPPRPFARVGDAWELTLGDLPVDRLEYQLEVERRSSSVIIERICAPDAPTVAQPFGAKSVLVLPAYRPPRWIDEAAPAGTLVTLELPSATLGGTVHGSLWEAPGLVAGTPAPLLVALDGPEYVQFSALDRFLAASVARGTLPPLRAALLAPRARNEDYSASETFADALAHELIPAIEQRITAPGPSVRIGLGASLGGLAMLHAHRRSAPALFGALVLQSGSFFDEQLDAQERGFRWFARITGFVREVVAAAPGTVAPVPVALTCGTGEENLANNRAMASALASQGYPVSFHEVRDGHTWTCWRDAFAPAFAEIARSALTHDASRR